MRTNCRELGVCEGADGFLGTIYQGNGELINWRLSQNSLGASVSKHREQIPFFEDTM